jgi:hypothetical protein
LNFQLDFTDTIPKSIPITIGKSLSGKGATIEVTNRQIKRRRKLNKNVITVGLYTLTFLRYYQKAFSHTA